MFFCTRPPKAPTTKRQQARTSNLAPLVGLRRRSRLQDAGEQHHGGQLGRAGEEGHDRRRRALVDVRRPHVERRGGDLEGQTADQEDQAEDQADIEIGRRRMRRCRGTSSSRRSRRSGWRHKAAGPTTARPARNTSGRLRTPWRRRGGRPPAHRAPGIAARRRHRARSGRRRKPSCPCRARPARSGPETRIGERRAVELALAQQDDEDGGDIDGHLGEDARRRSAMKEPPKAAPCGPKAAAKAAAIRASTAQGADRDHALVAAEGAEHEDQQETRPRGSLPEGQVKSEIANPVIMSRPLTRRSPR